MTTESANLQATTGAIEAKRLPREVRVVEDEGPMAYLLDTARFEHMQRIATLMANASLTPKHLRGTSPQEALGNCFLVVNQAMRWQLDPFAVAPETYEVGGKLGFQGKLVAALVNSRAGLEDRLRYEHSGRKGTDEFTVKVSGRFKGETEVRTVTLSVAQAKTTNKMWKDDPEQKLCYSGAIRWARRHCPEVLLGVLTDDDLERMRDNGDLEPSLKPMYPPRVREAEIVAPAAITVESQESAEQEFDPLEELRTMAHELGCPLSELNEWVGKSESESDPMTFLRMKPWEKSKGKQASFA